MSSRTTPMTHPTPTPHRTSRADVLRDAVYMIGGIIFCGFALKGFLVPNQFFDGGITGISLLIHELYNINIAYVIIIANIPLIIMVPSR